MRPLMQQLNRRSDVRVADARPFDARPRVARLSGGYAPRARVLWCAALLLAVAAWSSAAVAVSEGTTTQGTPFVSGGVTVEEQQDLGKRKSDYSLWVQTAAKGSGAFLAGARVRVSDTKGAPVLETEMDGPWLFARLSPGNYVVETTFEGKTEKRTVSIGKSGMRQVFLYFASDAEVSPDLEKTPATR